MSESGDSTSRASFSTGASSVNNDTSDVRALNAFNDKSGNDESISDLIEQNRNLQDGVFAGLYTLTKNRQEVSLRLTALRVVLEFLQTFRLAFNTTYIWNIDRDSWIWKAFYWVLFRFIVWDKGYDFYIAVFYVLAALIMSTVGLTLWVAALLKRADNSGAWLKRLVSCLQVVAFLIYGIFWVPIMDYIAFLFTCNWAEVATNPYHMYYKDHSCLAMPHLAHMCFAVIVLATHAAVTLCLSVADCDVNCMSRNFMASPHANTSFKVLCLKMVMVIVACCLDTVPTAQPIVMIICSTYTTYTLLDSMMYYYDWMNHLWIGLWTGITYTCALLVGLYFTPQLPEPTQEIMRRTNMTMGVLYGIFPCTLAGMAASYFRVNWARAPLQDLAAAQQDTELSSHLRDAYRFKDIEQVEFLARVMRKWDLDGIPDPEATEFGEFIIRVGLTYYPTSPFLLTMYANFMIEVNKDGQASRTQLQLASKNNPGFIDRYFIYVSQELAKKLRTESDGLDLLSYVEFNRNYRACVRAHRLAMMAQRHVWHTMLRDTVSFRDLQKSFDVMERTEKQAAQIYRRVMERYPNNGKLLKIYGRFLEFICNDPWTASKYYTEAMKLGVGESLLSLTSGTAGESNKMNSMMGQVDEKVDGIVIINAVGVIMMVNQAGSRMFGYEKAELDNKNVSMLMPQPFSQRHNSFLSRYITTGQPHILDKLQHVVGLHKDRSVFPVNLGVTKLSGTGPDSIFMGVLRPTQADDDTIVKLWTTTGGIILCADQRFSDWFGVAPVDLIGKQFSSLGADMEALDRYVADAAASANALALYSTSTKAPALCTKLLHRYLSAVDVELSVEFGGTEDQRILVMQVKCLADSMSMMVADHRGRIAFVTSKLCQMLGYSVKTLTNMDLQAILPPPFAQLHVGWMKDLSGKPSASSCRAGAVVHLLSANSSKVPVALKLSQHDDGEQTKHIIQVIKSDESVLLDQKRLVLTINHKGVVLSANPGASKLLFGINPSDLVGQHLSSFINVFQQWKKKFGEDDSLLMLLGMQAQDRNDTTFRAGIHPPENSHAEHTTQQAKDGGSKTLLTSLKQRNRVRPAIVTVEAIHSSDEADLDFSSENTAVLTMSLWKADAVSGVMELDQKLAIYKADQSAGLLLGLQAATLLKRSFKSLVGLPDMITGADMLNHLGGQGKKSGLKSGGAWRLGPVKQYEVTHSDGQPVHLEMQAISKDGQSSSKLVVRARILNPSCGALEPLLALKNKQTAEGSKSTRNVAAADSSEDDNQDNDDDGGSVDGKAKGPRGGAVTGKTSRSGRHDDLSDGSDDSGEDDDDHHGRPRSPELNDKLDSRLRTKNWVRVASKNTRQHQPPQQPKQSGMAASGANRTRVSQESGYGAYVQVAIRGSAPGNGRPPKGVDVDDEDDLYPGDDGGSGTAGGAEGGVGPYGRPGAGSVEGSEASGAEDGAGASSAAESEGNDDITSDWRRAKRLKKLNRIMTCTTAQSATIRFRRHTWALIAAILAAHVICFVVLELQIEDNYKNAYDVNDMARLVERAEMTSMRANYVQKCYLPEFVSMAACTSANSQYYLNKLKQNIEYMRLYHHGLYLGQNKLQSFKSKALMDFWTYTKLPEINFVLTNLTHQSMFLMDERATWEMGNRYMSAASEVHYWAPIKKHTLNDTAPWQYLYNNGLASMFTGLAWSLDTLVDYCWNELGVLNNVLILLLVIEAIIIQLAIIAYEFVLLKMATAQHMRRFSVFLALPSATIRAMAARVCQVDEDDKSDVDEDDMEMMAEAAAQNKAAEDKKHKSVRVSVAGPDEASGGRLTVHSPRDPNASKGASVKTSKNQLKSSKSGFHRVIKNMMQTMFWWTDSKIKINGKKLLPSHVVSFKFMVPLLLWVAAVIVMYGVSFQKLSALQGPLSSLNVAAHVIYRIARVRFVGNNLSFSLTASENVRYRALLMDELKLLRQEYSALLYGGEVITYADVSFDRNAPAGAFANKEFAHLFFKTTRCLRQDQTGCFKPGTQYYEITHTGLDAMVTRFIEEMTLFSKLPDDLAYTNATSYDYIINVGGHDMYDGLETATTMFVTYTISRFEEVKQLHVILLVSFCGLLVCYGVLLFRPYVARLLSESKAIAGMLSQLPAEVDVEGHVKHVLLNIRRDGAGNSMRGGSIMVGHASTAGGIPPNSSVLLMNQVRNEDDNV